MDADQETVRAAYIEIVKKVHPDSGHPDASAAVFTEVENAFRILQEKFAKERRGIRETADAAQECDIKVNVRFHGFSIFLSCNFLFFCLAYSATASTIFEFRGYWQWNASPTRKTISAVKSFEGTWKSISI